MLIKKIPGFLAFLLAISMLMPQGANAQMRAQRIREHERKIQEIISKRRAEAQEKEAERKVEEAKEAATTPQEPAEEEKKEERRTISNVVMGFKFINEKGQSAYNTIVGENETFVTEIYLFNVDQNPIERVRLALDYDKRFIRPVKIFDTVLRPYMEGEPHFEIHDREAIVQYDAKLSRPLTQPEVILLKILWKADRPTPFTGLEFAFSQLEADDEPHTAIYAEGRNILGIEDDPADGVLSGGLMIESPTATGKKMIQGKAEELKEIYLGSVAADATVGLEMYGPTEPLKVGDRFVVHVRLNNPEGALVDSINFAVLFDPKILQVVDEDKFNYIIRGTNVNDGPYHRNFPWDMHKRNEARNDRGLVEYNMALMNGASLPSKTFADIYFVAVAPTAKTELGFVKGRPGAPNMTSVRYFGYEKLELLTEKSKGSIALTVENAPVEIAAKPVEQIVESEAKEAEDLGVRKLKLER